MLARACQNPATARGRCPRPGAVKDHVEVHRGVYVEQAEPTVEGGYKDANGKKRTIGRFDTQEQAAHAVSAAIRRAGLEGRRKTNPVVDGQLVPRARKDGHGPRGSRGSAAAANPPPPRRRRAPAAARRRGKAWTLILRGTSDSTSTAHARAPTMTGEFFYPGEKTCGRARRRAPRSAASDWIQGE